MRLLEWSEEFRVGSASIDFEHQDLFERINDLYAECLKRNDADAVEDCLGKLHARLSAHFALEEKLMQEWQNPHYGEHKVAHENFLDDVTEIVAQAGQQSDTAALTAFARHLQDWLANHILTFDLKLVDRAK